MSTIDGLDTVNSAYKAVYDGKVGFDMTPLATYKNMKVTLHGDMFPLNGTLLFVVTNNLRLDKDINIKFKYRKADFTGYDTQHIHNIEVKIPLFERNDTEYEGEIVIEKSQQLYFEKIYNETETPVKHIFNVHSEDSYQKNNITPDHVYEITEIISVDPVEPEWVIYALSSNGAKLISGFSFNYFREKMDNIIRSFFVAPQVCPLCKGIGRYPAEKNGVKINQFGQMVDNYTGNVCPSCKGNGFVGWNANEEMVKIKAADVSINESYVSSIESLRDYAWATKHWLTPSERDLKGFVSRIAKVDYDDITIVRHAFLGDKDVSGEVIDKEPYFYILISKNVSEESIKIINDVLYYKMPIGYTIKVNATEYFYPTNPFPLTEGEIMLWYFGSDMIEYTDRSPDMFDRTQFGTEDDYTTYKSDGNFTAIKYDGTNRCTVSCKNTTVADGVYQDGDVDYNNVLNVFSGNFFSEVSGDATPMQTYIKYMYFDSFMEG